MSYSGIKNCAAKYAKEKGVSKREAENTIKDILSVFKTELLDPKCKGLQFVNFVTLKKVVRKGKVGRNPKNPEQLYEIPDQVSIKVIVGEAFKEQLNED